VAALFPTTHPGLRRDHPLLRIEEHDLDFIVQFVLASGSLKDMAQLYGVSYPTIRASLDRVIAALRDQLQRRRCRQNDGTARWPDRTGRIETRAAKAIRALHRKALETSEEGLR
jgi:hypothetical protein